MDKVIARYLDFGAVIRELKGEHSARCRRAGWNGKEMWITLSPGGQVPAEKFWAPHNKKFAEAQPNQTAEVLPYITMKTADNKIVPWLASQADMLAEDWELLDK